MAVPDVHVLADNCGDFTFSGVNLLLNRKPTNFPNMVGWFALVSSCFSMMRWYHIELARPSVLKDFF